MKKMAAEENQSFPTGSIKLNWETFLFIDNHVEYTGKDFDTTGKRSVRDGYHFLNTPFVPGVFHPPLG